MQNYFELNKCDTKVRNYVLKFRKLIPTEFESLKIDPAGVSLSGVLLPYRASG